MCVCVCVRTSSMSFKVTCNTFEFRVFLLNNLPYQG